MLDGLICLKILITENLVAIQEARAMLQHPQPGLKALKIDQTYIIVEMKSSPNILTEQE